jgi:hypothetical protein
VVSNSFLKIYLLAAEESRFADTIASQMPFKVSASNSCWNAQY